MFQFSARHYIYLMIISLLAFGFVFERAFRILFICLNDSKRILKILIRKKKAYMIHCVVFSALMGLFFITLLCAKLVQTRQIKKEIESFNSAKVEAIEFKTKSVMSMLNKQFEAIEVSLPEFFERALDRENPKQLEFTDFLKVVFAINDSEPQGKVSVFAKYKDTQEFTPTHLRIGVGSIINATDTCPIPLTFRTGDGLNTLFMPIYYSRTTSPLVGIELVAEGKPIEIKSVEKILETDNIRTQSAFLIPSQPDEMKYTGNIDWGRVFWGKME